MRETDKTSLRKVETFKGLDIYVDQESLVEPPDSKPLPSDSSKQSQIGSIDEKSVRAIKKIKL